MKIQTLIEDLNIDEDQSNKLLSIKRIKESTGIGLREAKNIAHLYFDYTSKNINDHKYGKNVINHLKSKFDWSIIKRNIKNSK